MYTQVPSIQAYTHRYTLIFAERTVGVNQLTTCTQRSPTFLSEIAVGLEVTYERLRLGGVGVGVENLVEARVALFRVEEVPELLGRQVRLLVRTPACRKQTILSRLHAVNNESCHPCMR